jgi:hypothetical protein
MCEGDKRRNNLERGADIIVCDGMANCSGGIMRLANSGLKPIAMLLASMIELVHRVNDN